jgi:hypothetical protein
MSTTSRRDSRLRSEKPPDDAELRGEVRPGAIEVTKVAGERPAAMTNWIEELGDGKYTLIISRGGALVCILGPQSANGATAPAPSKRKGFHRRAAGMRKAFESGEKINAIAAREHVSASSVFKYARNEKRRRA